MELRVRASGEEGDFSSIISTPLLQGRERDPRFLHEVGSSKSLEMHVPEMRDRTGLLAA